MMNHGTKRTNPDRYVLGLLLVLAALTMACAVAWSPEPAMVVPGDTLSVRPTVPPVTSVPTSSHTEPLLCFTIEVPIDWKIDGHNGGVASFWPPAGRPWFNVSNVALKTPTLPEALDNVRAGSLGPRIQEVQDIVISGEPAHWIVFTPGTEFSFVAILIRPECRRGPGALFIAAKDSDEAQFESFFRRIRLVK